jgi:hypothetical protein
MVAGLASTLPRTLTAGLHGQGVPLDIASKVAHLPPVSTMFAALLGYNPIHNLLDPTGVLHTLSVKQVGVLTGKQFFPDVISGPFHHGLVIVFTAAAIMSFIGAMVSLLRGKQFYYKEPSAASAVAAAAPVSGANGANGNGNGNGTGTGTGTGTGNGVSVRGTQANGAPARPATGRHAPPAGAGDSLG